MAWPHVFASLGGDVPASYLDDNFNAAAQIGSHTGNTLWGNNDNSGNNADLTPSQVYGLLKSQIPWELTAFQGGLPASGWIIAGYQPSTDVLIVQGSCYAFSGTASTGTAIFPIKNGPTSVGNVTFLSGNVAGSVTLNTTTYELIIGQRLTITAPGSADATLADINITLGGVRT